MVDKTEISLVVDKTQKIKNIRELSKISNKNIDNENLIFGGFFFIFFIFFFYFYNRYHFKR
jgi:hypothetical protein